MLPNVMQHKVHQWQVGSFSRQLAHTPKMSTEYKQTTTTKKNRGAALEKQDEKDMAAKCTA